MVTKANKILEILKKASKQVGRQIPPDEELLPLIESFSKDIDFKTALNELVHSLEIVKTEVIDTKRNPASSVHYCKNCNSKVILDNPELQSCLNCKAHDWEICN